MRFSVFNDLLVHVELLPVQTYVMGNFICCARTTFNMFLNEIYTSKHFIVSSLSREL